MNASFDSHVPDSHVPEDALEAYSMGKLSDQAGAPFEEHLLVCPVCQTRLETMDAYIRIVRAASAALPPPSNLRTMPSQVRARDQPRGGVSLCN